jgi:hypothetical protein
MRDEERPMLSVLVVSECCLLLLRLVFYPIRMTPTWLLLSWDLATISGIITSHTQCTGSNLAARSFSTPVAITGTLFVMNHSLSFIPRPAPEVGDPLQHGT